MNRSTKNNVSVFDYLDYRHYLRDWYATAKKSRASFSLRTFSQRAGFTSSNYFKLVMDGDRNLTDESIGKFVVGLRLPKGEQDFFKNLVFFNQATTPERKNHYYAQLLQSRQYNKIKPLEKDQYDYYSTWYHAVIRELMTSPEFDGSFDWLSRRVFPSISVGQARKSVDLLEKLGFIRKNKDGRWEQSTPLLTTGAEAASLVALSYHQNLLEMIRETIGTVPPSRRDVSALTLGITADKLSILKRRLQEFRQEILSLVSADTQPERVVILSIQLMPATHEPEERKS